RFIESNRRDIKNYDAAANYAENMLRICAENNISDKYRKYYKDMLYKFRDRFINVIEIDSRNVGLQSGIARYFNVLGAQMPENIRMKKIIFYHSVDIKEIKICDSENELQIFHPEKFQIHTLYEAVFQWLASRLEKMKNIIVKCNCLGCENFAYLIRSRFVCKTVGVLHCLPNHSLNSAKKRLINPESAIFPQSNPFKLMDHIILVCDSGKEFLQGVRNDIPFSVIYNGISAPKISVNKPNDGKFRFIFANGLGGHKGFDKIIPAIRSVAAKHDIEILVLGGGKLSDVAGKVAADLPVRFLGFIKDRAEIARYYEMADAALFASASEACSFAGIEAMAHNLPIVSTNAAGLQEMFGKAALFATMTRDELKGTFEINTDEYADHMISIIENSRLQRKLQVLGYARYLERYTARKMVRDTVKVYEQLCS
ncbi:MAG: glycosyltransferase family 4 protein, partial [Rickettsiales bacterium]|nr:glycosyltransferase family 4 protein [Rickettsiales bacterium]